MSEFIFWNVVATIVFVIGRIAWGLLPRGTAFAVLSVANTRLHGTVGIVLVNDKQLKVFRTGSIWRFQVNGTVLPDDWSGELDDFERTQLQVEKAR